jgi:phage gp36-like protein
MYSTLTDILAHEEERTLIQLTDDDQGGAIDEDKVTAAILLVDEEINGYIRSRGYAVPLADPIPALVMGISRDLAIEELYSRKSELGVPEAVKDKAKRARDKLADIQMGKLSLGIEAASGPGYIGGNKTAADKIFNKDTMAGFR